MEDRVEKGEMLMCRVLMDRIKRLMVSMLLITVADTSWLASIYLVKLLIKLN